MSYDSSMSGPRMRRLVTAVATGVGLTLTIAVAPASATGVPHIRNGETVPVYSYENAIRESVWVQTPLDNDGDGKRDEIAVDIVRPRETAARHLRVPVVMEGSPYYSCCGRGNES